MLANEYCCNRPKFSGSVSCPILPPEQFRCEARRWVTEALRKSKRREIGRAAVFYTFLDWLYPELDPALLTELLNVKGGAYTLGKCVHEYESFSGMFSEKEARTAYVTMGSLLNSVDIESGREMRKELLGGFERKVATLDCEIELRRGGISNRPKAGWLLNHPENCVIDMMLGSGISVSVCREPPGKSGRMFERYFVACFNRCRCLFFSVEDFSVNEAGWMKSLFSQLQARIDLASWNQGVTRGN